MAAEVPQTLEYRGSQLNAAPLLVVENFTNWKKRFMCHIISIEPQFKTIIENGPFILMTAGQRKPEDFQDSPDDEEDTRSSQEYLNDLEEEYQARALLAKSKRILLAESQRNTTDPPVAVTDSSETAYDSANESLVYNTPVPSLKRLDGAEPLITSSLLNLNDIYLMNIFILTSLLKVVLEIEVSSDQNGQADQNDQPAQADEILNDDQFEHSNDTNDEQNINNLSSTEEIQISEHILSKCRGYFRKTLCSRLQSTRRHRQDETFAPVARLEAIRIFLAFATYMNFIVYQMDVKSAFLNGKLKEEVYIKQTLGFESTEFPNHVCKLDKALYGLKQAPRAWYLKVAAGCYANILWIKSQLIDHDIIYEKRSYSQRDIELHLIPTQYQLADIFTKSLDEPTIKRLIVELGMLNIDSKPKPSVQTEEKLRFSNFMQN
ncbi:retrovirus-related pol polyprotein from transposon TNT 1-94 [Tanacetum coccineum]